MTQMTNDIYAVEVPEGATGFDINKYSNGSELNYWLIAGAKDTLIVIDLPPGNWQLICTAKEVSKEQAIEVVKQYGKYFIDFTATEQDWKEKEVNWSETPIDSLRSLLTSKGLDLNKNYVLIKKLTP